MEKVRLHIDTINYEEKPKKKEFAFIKPRLQNENTIQEVDLNELMEKIGQGYAVSPAVMKGGLKKENWYMQSLFMIDIDNKEEELPHILSLEEALNICKVNNVLPVFYYYTFSHSEELPRFRLVFMLDKPTTDVNIRNIIMRTLINLFSKRDNACFSSEHVFLGTNKKCVVCDLNSRITVDGVLKLSDFKTFEGKVDKDNQLNRLKSSFDLLSYMCKDNDISNTTEDIVYFSNCSVCGHNDCLRYYPKSNSFYCYGANGNIGGSIIDYLMVTEKLSMSEAINKFKYELCNLQQDDCVGSIEYYTAEELQKMDLPPVKFYVDGLIPQGLTLICSVPKLGKSWLALQLCLSLTKGTKFLGFNTNHCACLYLSLEDSPNRLLERISILLGDSAFPGNLYLNNYNKDLNNGLIDELRKVISIHSDIGIIVIDTLQKIRGVSKGSNVYANDYFELSKLKRFADIHNIGIVLIHHLKKGTENNDVFERVSGTNGITGTADTTLVLSKKNRGDEYTQLSVVGRDVEYNEYTITFDKDRCTWNMVGLTELMDEFIKRQTYNIDTLVATIKTLVEKNNGIWKGTFKELNLIHKEFYGDFYVPSEHRLRSCVNDLKSLLMLKDNIEYIPASKNPTNEGRVQTFRKVTNNN